MADPTPATTAPSAPGTPVEPHWSPGLEAMREERTIDRITRVEGRIPRELQGTLYRIGPGQTDVGGRHYHHWFDGDGMVCAFRFEDGQVGFRNRYVRTPAFERERAAGRMLYPNFGTPAPGGILRNGWRPPKNPANTHAMVMDDRLLALWEGGRPWALDPDDLSTLGEWDFHGTLPKGAFFSAHPHVDGKTGAVYNVGMAMGAKPGMNVWRVGADGRVDRLAKIALDKPFMVHDYGLTDRHVVILAGPFYMKPARLPGFLLGRRSLLDCFAWHGDEPMRAYVVNRDGGGEVARYELPTGLMFHTANAYAHGNEIVMDAVIYPDDGALNIVQDAYHGRTPADDPGRLVRVRLGPGGRAVQEPIAGAGLDFPRIDDRRGGHAYRFAYALEFRPQRFASSRILRIDTRSGKVESHDFGSGCYAGEPVFVPRPGGRNEDDGWVLSLVYDATDHHSFVAVVPAAGFGGADARAHLPFHTPIGFHGSFCPR